VPVVGVVARLHPQKGHEYLIKAARVLADKFKDLKIVLVGDGELRAELEQAVVEAGLSETFIFLGFRSDVRDLLSMFDIFVLPSLYEGLPNVILEAMATNLPVVATSVDGTVELVDDGETGYLVPPRDPGALVAKIGNLLESADLRRQFGRAGRKKVEEQYSLELQVENFQNLYEQYSIHGATMN